ncbi:DUF397 domain-containing protein [Kibdelosporangium phytohabitans]|uniref:DUF397 domain-containing protein n=1 Tax=Kibdelosporangium phytohabitans TaxID=860235 RepID=A0A0N9IDI8_9PSEU|nr:DUF397 domain-containing protein [Kibdelosporangium phytohabitans]ALG13124.1 hypothetical protein AOZ06_45295 [Kibdelosporangium phytohabitans]MBE1464868.1 hypothetical protein [Kibdelosporangium phytohabitans]
MRWRKSSFSTNNGDCVEVAWTKSSFSANNGSCVEVSVSAHRVAARDSKNATSPILTFDHPAWASFLTTITR